MYNMDMFWADEVLKNLSGKQLINDSFTPSGPVHMGSLKGPVIHDTLHRILKEKNQEVEMLFNGVPILINAVQKHLTKV